MFKTTYTHKPFKRTATSLFKETGIGTFSVSDTVLNKFIQTFVINLQNYICLIY